MYTIYTTTTVEQAKKVPLAEALGTNTVAELKAMIDSFCLPVNKSGRKQQLIDDIIAYISANPMWLKEHLRFCELGALHEIAEEGHYECISMMAYLNRLIRYGLLYVSELPEEGSDKIYMPAELKEILSPCFKQEKDYDINETVALYQICLGMANICGAVKFSEIIAYMQSFGHDIKWPHEISLLLEKYGYLEYTDVVLQPEGTMQVLYSPWLEFLGFPRAKIELGREIKYFPPEDVIKSANEIFLLPPSNPCDKRLDNFMKRNGMADDIQWVKMEAYNYHQEGGNGYLSILSDLTFKDQGQVQEFVRILTDYTNNVPMWRFRGWSSEEVFRGRISYDSEPGRGTVITNGDTTYRRDAKIGRNDPCPCGSGKKYKKCCGKNS